MTLEVGETVVYPHHGAARIIDIRQRKVKCEEKTYLQLEVAQGDLTILVPAESVELIGVRDARYADIYRDLLNFLHEQGRTMGAINDRYVGDERLENPHKAPSHFIDCLQEVGAVEWKNRGWRLTDLGENYLKKNATAQA